jgi:hypothetical protein
VGRVAEVDDVFVGQHLRDGLRHGKPANAGVKNADGIVAYVHAGRIYAYFIPCLMSVVIGTLVIG